MVAVEIGRRAVEFVKGGDPAHVVTGRPGQVQAVGELDGVGQKHAGGTRRSVQAVFFLLVLARHHPAIGIEDAFLLGLHETHPGMVIGGAGRQLMACRRQVPLAADAVAALHGTGAVVGARFLIRHAVERATFEAVVGIAIERARGIAAMIDIARQALAVAEPEAAIEGDLRQIVARLVRVGEDCFTALGEHRQRHQPVARHLGAGAGQAEVGFGGTAAIRELAEELSGFGRRTVTPAILLEIVGRHIPAERPGLAAVFQLDAAAPEAAAGQFGTGAGIGKAVLGTNRQSTAEGVEAEHRIRTGHQVDAGNCRIGQQFPVHRVTEGFIDAHAVNINRQPLRRTEQGRGGETAVVEIGLKRIALDLVEIDAGQLAGHELGQAQRLLLFQLAAADALDIGRHVQPRDADTGQRRIADDLNGLGSHHRLGMRRERRKSSGQRQAAGSFEKGTRGRHAGYLRVFMGMFQVVLLRR